METYRQGDLLFRRVDTLPNDLLEVTDKIILRGESTGHAHKIQKGRLFKDKNEMMFLSIPYFGVVVHEEHNPIKLPKGSYAVIRQREYSSADMTKLVID